MDELTQSVIVTEKNSCEILDEFGQIPDPVQWSKWLPSGVVTQDNYLHKPRWAHFKNSLKGNLYVVTECVAERWFRMQAIT